jgi:hypothetical protein
VERHQPALRTCTTIPVGIKSVLYPIYNVCFVYLYMFNYIENPSIETCPMLYHYMNFLLYLCIEYARREKPSLYGYLFAFADYVIIMFC